MKNIYTKLCLSAIGCLMMASCDFLDVVPQGTATVDDIYRTQYQAEGMVLSCYANIPNYFHPQQFPDFTGGNEIITSKGGTTRWFHFRSLVYGEESPTTTYYSLWSNTAKSYPQGAVKKAVWESIRNCYNVLNNLDRVSDITPENLSWWKGEALFLIGYYHQIMLEYYGPIVRWFCIGFGVLSAFSLIFGVFYLNKKYGPNGLMKLAAVKYHPSYIINRKRISSLFKKRIHEKYIKSRNAGK